MFRNKSEAHERVLCAIEDIKACCEVEDHFNEWSDVAASSIQAFLEELIQKFNYKVYKKSSKSLNICGFAQIFCLHFN